MASTRGAARRVIAYLKTGEGLQSGGQFVLREDSFTPSA
jgi:hypothetical protein